MSYLFAPERFEADDFVLRSYQIGDGALLAEARNESYEHLRPWMPWATPQISVRDAERVARQARGRYLLCQDFTLAVLSNDEQRLLGGTGFHLRDGGLESGCAEIGMFIRQSEAGRGLGTRVLSAMLRWGFDEWPWQRLSWRCDRRNQASLRVAEHAGLRHEGVLRGERADVGEGRRDTACYGLTRDEWRARRA
jgi:RimJ/RimL family protein N-acetyltransferase